MSWSQNQKGNRGKRHHPHQQQQQVDHALYWYLYVVMQMQMVAFVIVIVEVRTEYRENSDKQGGDSSTTTRPKADQETCVVLIRDQQREARQQGRLCMVM